jgi:probable F420-dependent oxidoreductase
VTAVIRIGFRALPQHGDWHDIREASVEAERMGVETLWTWDHFFPLRGDPDGKHFECWTVLSALAEATERAEVGALVTCNSYRNPNLLADMARTIDHLSVGRFVLGIGSGWFERDYREYGYEFGTAPSRLRELAAALPVIMQRFDRLEPPPRGRLPIMIGGSGERVTLRLVAEHADAWNTFGPPENFAKKSRVLDEWCERLGRNPRQIERTVGINVNEVGNLDAYVEAGAEHLIVMVGPPFDLDPVKQLLDAAR